MRKSGRRAHILVAKQFLDRADIRAGLDQMRGKRMSQRVAGRGLATAAPYNNPASSQVTPLICASSACTSSRLSTVGSRSGRFARRMSSIHGNCCSNTSRYRNSNAASA